MTRHDKIHVGVCDYLKSQYPNVPFTSDPSGLKTSIGMAKRLKRMRSRGRIPDMIIFYPSRHYSGLFIEIKLDKSQVFTRSGKMRKSDRIRGQADMLRKLNNLGYAATFGFGFGHIKKIIDTYMDEKPIPIIDSEQVLQNGEINA